MAAAPSTSQPMTTAPSTPTTAPSTPTTAPSRGNTALGRPRTAPIGDGYPDRSGRDRAVAVAMFRYELIRQAADPGISTKARGRMVRALAATEHIDPAGRPVRYSRDHLDRWIRAWRRGGFDALVPRGRAPYARTDALVLETAAALKRERPARTAAQIERILTARAGWSPSQSTLLRHFHRLELQITPADDDYSEVVFGRFEADRCSELWTGDALHGPRIGGRKTYLFAFIDDHSRLIVGSRWGFAEDAVRLAAALRPALASRGVPDAVYVDNGSAFVDAWLLRACAKLGIRLTHSTPGRPQGRGKIERFFKTVNDQFLVEIDPPRPAAETSDGSAAAPTTSVPPAALPLATGTSAAVTGPDVDPAAGLLELNHLFNAWVEQVYHRSVHSETGQTPLDRWNTGWADRPPTMARTEALTEAFLWETERRVRKTATIFLHNNTYEVDASLVGRKVELVYDPFNLDVIQVRYRGRPMGRAVPHVITRHSHPKARPEIPDTPPAATGIDYLQLLTTAHDQQQASAINFDALTGGDHPGPGGAAAGGEVVQVPGQLDITELLTGDGSDRTAHDASRS